MLDILYPLQTPHIAGVFVLHAPPNCPSFSIFRICIAPRIALSLHNSVGKRRRCLYLLSTPSSCIGVAHVAWGFDRWNEFECNVAKTDDANNGSSNVAEDLLAEEETTDENVENTSSDKGEEKVGVSRNLRGDLEFKKSDSQPENEHVDAKNNGLKLMHKDADDATENGDGRDDQVHDAKDIGELHCNAA